jgi:tripartite-type tricarboxylate transporter receptor subunit TctC
MRCCPCDREDSSFLISRAAIVTPKKIYGKLSAAIGKAVQETDLKARFSKLQSETAGSTPAQMREMIQNATVQWGRVIVEAKIRID